MKKFTETEYYKKWYSQIEEEELKRIDKDRLLREFAKVKDSLGKDEISFEEQAILFAQCIHRPQLKSPSQATYPDFREFDVKSLGKDLWEVSGYCDAPNSYGATTRGNLNVCMKYNNDQFEYVVSKTRIHNTMIRTAAICAFVLLFIFTILYPMLLL